MFPFDRLIAIDKNSKKPIYLQIAFILSEAIRNGVLQAGTPIPSSRDLAKQLNLHRKTIVAAYEELSAQEWITVVPRKKTVVSSNIPILQPKKWNSEQTLRPYENPMQAPFKKQQVIGLQKDNRLVEIIIDDGRPDIRISPIDLLLKTYRSLIQRRYATQNLEQNMAQGSLALRTELVTYLAESRGLNSTIDNLLITSGAQMSIYLSSQLLLERGDFIIVGTPNYPMANQVFQQSGGRLIEVDVDQYGLDMEQVEKHCQNQPVKAVYVIPHHHYPTTVTLSVERRMKLLSLSKKYHFVIIEDDYDYDYHYSSSPYLPLATAQHRGNIIYIGSFSKVLDPSLRIGFMVAAKNFIDQAVIFRKMIDIGGDGYMQDALAGLIREGELKRHLKKSKRIYQLRKDHLDQLLREQLSPYISYRIPSGGMAIWVGVDPQYPLFQLRQLALTLGLQINDINETHNAFRFGFASLHEKDLSSAIAILSKCFNQLSKTIETI